MRRSVVYSWGHRNVEGLDWDSRGRLWATEFGDHKVDELNLIRPGRNYGWPIVEGRSSNRRFTNPKTTWPTDAAGPSGIAINGHPRPDVRLHRRADRSPASGGCGWPATAWSTGTALWTGKYGRIRTTAIGHGDLWITTSNTDGRSTPRPVTTS